MYIATFFLITYKTIRPCKNTLILTSKLSLPSKNMFLAGQACHMEDERVKWTVDKNFFFSSWKSLCFELNIIRSTYVCIFMCSLVRIYVGDEWASNKRVFVVYSEVLKPSVLDLLGEIQTIQIWTARGKRMGCKMHWLAPITN